jgi:predicted ATPase/DNA-binding winged helix-turn-helix (wHTH) protein
VIDLKQYSMRTDAHAGRGRGPAGVADVDVFVSYASPDAGLAAALVEVLEATRLRCWIAPRDVVPGTMYADGIMRAINDARVIALVLSEHSVASSHVGREIERAAAKHRPVIALRVDAAPLTPALEYFLSESQWVDLGPGGIEQAGATLAEAIRRHRSASEPAEPRQEAPAADVLRVGSFEISPSERRLSAGGQPIEIGARAFDLLVVLAETPGRLVTKTTLLERVWRGLVVDENNLPAQIASLRRVLGAGAIRTVPGFGYRLELGVAPTGSSEPSKAAPAAPPPLSVPRRAWPDRLVPLVGRDDDVAGVQEALTQAGLVTVVGGAGVGKTRLAQEILTRESEAQRVAAWVALESIEAAQHIPSAIALALGLSLPDGVDGFTALRQALEEVPLLLVLDGAEHLAEALAAPLSALVSQTRGVRVLVTSQTPLGVTGEIVYRLTALPVPDAGSAPADAAAFPALALFAQRAAAADRRFELNAANTPVVAAICRRLDGNPLALELAAARVPGLGVAALLERLDDRFRLLKLGNRAGDPRHGTLQAAFEWSYGLLTAAEKRVFNRLGAFAGSFSLDSASRCVADETTDAAEAIDLIGRLVDRSLVTTLPVEPPRYALLETARYFALDRLQAAGELESAKRHMATATLQVLDAAYAEYWSLDEAIWLQRHGAELENVRAAIDWATANDAALAVALYGSAWPMFAELELFAEARARFDQTVGLLVETQPHARAARFWEAVATYDSSRQFDRARHAADLAARLHRESGDIRSRYYSLMQLALNWRGDDVAARAAFDEAQALEDAAWPARLLTHGALTHGALLLSAGQFIEARTAYRRAVHLALTVSERQALAATVNIVELDLACGDTAAALQLGRPLSLSLRQSGRRAAHFDLLGVMFGALLLAGETDEARATAAELHDLAVRLDPGKLYTVLDAMAYLAGVDARYEAAARIAACADAAHVAHGQARRRPTEERLRLSVTALLEQQLGAGWRAAAELRPLDESRACLLALGYEA